jgi:hypothetical protein
MKSIWKDWNLMLQGISIIAKLIRENSHLQIMPGGTMDVKFIKRCFF